MSAASSQHEREQARRFDFRLAVFEELGFAFHEAEALARSQIDWHELKELLDRGCSHELAWEILR